MLTCPIPGCCSSETRSDIGFSEGAVEISGIDTVIRAAIELLPLLPCFLRFWQACRHVAECRSMERDKPVVAKSSYRPRFRDDRSRTTMPSLISLAKTAATVDVLYVKPLSPGRPVFTPPLGFLARIWSAIEVRITLTGRVRMNRTSSSVPDQSTPY